MAVVSYFVTGIGVQVHPLWVGIGWVSGQTWPSRAHHSQSWQALPDTPRTQPVTWGEVFMPAL
jgi:hypothetical protein